MAELNGSKIYEKLDAIDGKVDQLLIWRAEHTKQHEMLERDVADNRSVLFDTPGIIGKVNQLYNSRNRDKAWSGFWVDVLKFLVATATVAIVTWLLVIYKQS